MQWRKEGRKRQCAVAQDSLRFGLRAGQVLKRGQRCSGGRPVLFHADFGRCTPDGQSPLGGGGAPACLSSDSSEASKRERERERQTPRKQASKREREMYSEFWTRTTRRGPGLRPQRALAKTTATPPQQPAATGHNTSPERSSPARHNRPRTDARHRLGSSNDPPSQHHNIRQLRDALLGRPAHPTSASDTAEPTSRQRKLTGANEQQHPEPEGRGTAGHAHSPPARASPAR